MKTKVHQFLVGLIFFCSSCSDDNITNNDSIIGKWKLVEIYDGYANGGSFTWSTVSITHSEIIDFTSNGQYFENIDSPDKQVQCKGGYQVLSDNLVELESSFQTVLVRLKIGELSQTTLIIDRQGREGVTRYKYTSW